MRAWFRREIQTSPSQLVRTFTDEGLFIGNDVSGLGENAASMAKPVLAGEIQALIHQFEDDGYVVSQPGGHLVPWEALYEILEHPGYRPSVPLLLLPPVGSYIPALESRGALTDRAFSVAVAGWRDGDGRPIAVVKLTGALLHDGRDVWLLSRPVWQLVRSIATFQMRNESQRSENEHRRAWAAIRSLAIAANARLDDFLRRTVILTPSRLQIGLEKNEIGGTKVIEVIPSFAGAPEAWLRTFDAHHQVPDRYDIPTPGGIVQILVTPEVKTVLQQIKRLPGRRVAGSRAEAFIMNPFATLGEDAGRVIDPDQFERAREEAGLLFERFTAHVQRDATGYPLVVGLLIERAGAHGPTSSELYSFRDDEELAAFIRLVRMRLAEGMQLCAWHGYDFELLGDTPSQLDILEKALSERRKPRVLIHYADIYDLTRYAERIEQIGTDKPYYSPFIAKKNNDEEWIPDNIIPVIAWTPDEASEPVAVPLTDERIEQVKAKVAEAKAAGHGEIRIAGFDKPFPVKDAEAILSAIENVRDAVEKGTFDPGSKATDNTAPGVRPTLVIRANIQNIDYEETRRDILTALPAEPKLPRALNSEVTLRDHQRSGVAWLQHLFAMSPHHCRGAVLADDMGLGKTLQLLTLIAAAFEETPDLDPALVVAPVSLLENWKEELERFFLPGSLPLLTAYGETLSRLRVPRTSIDEQLRKEGLIKFLKPGWRGSAKIVLTTYETLRDLEFTFAAEKWSIMVCDEAQKIKNPAALVTRAAKKQNVRFKIACTGTPVENTLTDLWCLFDFVQPGLLGALNDFGHRYRKPIEAETDEEKARVEELRAKIRPQILRRTKEDVAKDLPKKIVVESCRKLPISAHQRMLYSQAIELFKRRNDPSMAVPFKNHLGLLHYLRLICTDPRRYGLDEFRPEPLREYRARAPKLDWLLRTLEDIRRRGEKAIIFCEFRTIQRLLRHYIEEALGYSPDIINGDTVTSASHGANRQKRIKAFQAQPGFGAIILSPLAVGFGLNIQAANHVIHYTRTWNPAKEDQATDRAYRIGQNKDVYVYYPVVHADDFTTFDVKLDRLLEYKRELARDMLNGAGDVTPRDFDFDDMVPEGAGETLERPVTLDDVLRMRPDYFECYIAVLWQRKGFRTVYRTPESHDDGVDVVAIGPRGELIQCKSSTVDGTALGWEAIKDVVTGEAAYRLRHPGVEFRKVCVTNQFFNETARRHAALNDVELYDQRRLAELIERYPVTLMDIERQLFPNWEYIAA